MGCRYPTSSGGSDEDTASPGAVVHPLGLWNARTLCRAHAVQATDTSSTSQDPYLFTKFVLLRAAIYFAAWLLLAYLLNHWSRKQDRTTDQRWSRRLQTLSGPGLVVYGFTATFAGIDWVMSLQADWNSTIFGMLVMGSQVLSALAFIVIISRRSGRFAAPL